MLNFYKKKDLPKLKLMGRSTRRKYIFKDRLIVLCFAVCLFPRGATCLSAVWIAVFPDHTIFISQCTHFLYSLILVHV